MSEGVLPQVPPGGSRTSDRRDGVIDSRGESVRPMASLAIIICRLIRTPHLRTSRPAALCGKAEGWRDGRRRTVIDHTAPSKLPSHLVRAADERAGREINRARGSIDDVLTR